ncbi:carotenoid isomerase [Acaryochloris sp. IP29b_bin.148]|uniref:carotenoid isomerase n=1 Tax=Acaryochloris sp. IP29b_bin.148 TaxID=2969218 RepID=UPI0026352D63|nr:carotenoid isomerase [Acaryochloris sp. IP29b_bin.148]
MPSSLPNIPDQATEYDAIVIGSGIGGLVTATQLAAKGANVLALERYLIPGGSAGYFEHNGYRFDVGASMIFGFGDRGTTNLLTRALAAVNQQVETIPDPVQIHYHLPQNLDLKVHRDYEKFLQELISRFPHERHGIRQFYDTCWQIFNSLNSMELLSLEELGYLARSFWQHPGSCFRLLQYLPRNVGDYARRYIKDPILLKFIDMECYCWSVVPAAQTPMINAGMVFSDRHYGGVNYPKGGVGQIALKLVEGLEAAGSQIHYRARVNKVILEQGTAVGVELATGETYRGQRIISNATRWDTFGHLVDEVPPAEAKWRQRYKKSPSFLSLHLGVEAEALPANLDCHHILLSDWDMMAEPGATVFVSIPTLLDASLAPPRHHIVHAFTPSWVKDWQVRSQTQYNTQKQEAAQQLISRLQQIIPNLGQHIHHMEVGTPRTHRRFLGRQDGTYGPIPSRQLWGLVGMPFNRTAIPGLYCVGDSTFPGQGLNAVAFSGFACAHRVAKDLRL